MRRPIGPTYVARTPSFPLRYLLTSFIATDPIPRNCRSANVLHRQYQHDCRFSNQLGAPALYLVRLRFPSSSFRYTQSYHCFTCSPIAARAYAAALLLISLLAIGVHVAHARARRDVCVSVDPTTMAATLSMTSESSFPKLLHAGDTEEDMEKTLRGMRFGISRRTWQVVVEGGDSEEMTDFKDNHAYPAHGSGLAYGLPSAADSRSSFTTVVPSTYSEVGNGSGKPVDPWAKVR